MHPCAGALSSPPRRPQPAPSSRLTAGPITSLVSVCVDKALEYAFDVAGVTHLTVLAALGGRIDHDLGNLGLLVRLAMGERLVFEDVDQRVLAVAGEISLQAHPGETWSFWTFDPTVHVTIEGVRWPVAGAALDVSRRPSISNEATTDEIRIRATGGAVVVTRHHR
jgi:thiamine pyrophosphokinase